MQLKEQREHDEHMKRANIYDYYKKILLELGNAAHALWVRMHKVAISLDVLC